MMRGRLAEADILVVAGGVAAEQRSVRASLDQAAAAHGFRMVAPPMRLCSDNAVMVAWAGDRAPAAWADRRPLDVQCSAALAARGACAARAGMNYRHEYHAGNFADCFKHALLVCPDRRARAQTGAVLRVGHPCGRRPVRPAIARRRGARARRRLGSAACFNRKPRSWRRYIWTGRGDSACIPGHRALIQALLRTRTGWSAANCIRRMQRRSGGCFARDPRVSVARTFGLGGAGRAAAADGKAWPGVDRPALRGGG